MKSLLILLLVMSMSLAQTIEQKIQQYQSVPLKTDLSLLNSSQKEQLKLLIEAAKMMDFAYKAQRYPKWEQTRNALSSPAMQRYFDINYGPYDILDNEKPFVPGVAPRPEGLYFYPADMTKEEFEAYTDLDKNSLYTVIGRSSDGKLFTQWYHDKYAIYHNKAAELLNQAAALNPQSSFGRFLSMRAEALQTDSYVQSDAAWLDMKDNQLDIVIGPIESYDDGLFGIKTSYEAYVLVKDMAWSERLARFGKLLPELQKGLPVPDAYKTETPGTGDLNAYDAVYYAGDCNAGPKTIAINLPNDEGLQLEKGTRRLQLKNAMKAKFDHILKPISDVLIAPSQRQYIKFDAFFSNVMFHEVAHGLGIKNVISGGGLVKEALKETHSTIEEAKADVLGLYMVQQLMAKGHLQGSIEEQWVTFVAGIFRSTRFGAGSAHGKANMLELYHLLETGAVKVNDDGYFEVVFENMEAAVASLARKILMMQGDGDYSEAKFWIAEKTIVAEGYQKQLDKLAEQGIPVDIVFEQGREILGLY